MHRTCWMVILVFLFVTIGYGQGELEKLPPGVNTDQYDESAPILGKDGSRLFFTRTASPDFETTILLEDGVLINNFTDTNYRQRLVDIYSEIAGRQVNDPEKSVFNQDIWVVPIQEDSVGIPYHPGYPLNNALPNSLVSTGMQPDEFVVINQFFTDGSMYSGFSRVKILANGKHTFPQPMHIYEFDVNSSDVNLTMSPGGLYVILSLERPGTIGKNDLYVSFYVRDNVWSGLEHMGDVINTEFQETTPHISPDRRFLYFSSNRPGGLGGNDIYVSERLDYTWLKWSKPVLLKGEINSSSDDSQPSFTPGNNYMYFTSRRDGSSDLFRVRLTPKPKLKKSIYVKGSIVSSKTGQLIRSELLWGPQSGKGYLEFFNSYNGHFEALLTEYEPYKFLPRKPGHYGQNIMVDPRIIERLGKDTVEIVLYLDPKELQDANISEKQQVTSEVITSESSRSKESPPDPDRKVFVYDINFVKAKPIILTKSSNALKQLLFMMESNPAMEIRVEGHTDNVGDEIALIDLSNQRAAAIRDYLVLNGIATERIHIEGFGATRPIHKNDTEAGREKNRRVEITIIKT
ncbi:MAG: OmpA family protein [Saprospiraceae bacterium]